MPTAPSAEVTTLHRELVEVCQDRTRLEHRAAVLLCRMFESGGFRELGYAGIHEYAAALGLTPRKARDLLRVGRALPAFPVLGAALEAGELPWTKARELLPVLTPENGPTWVALAGTLTNRELEAHVYAALPTGDPTDPVRPPFSRLVLRGETARVDLVRDAFATLRAALGIEDAEVSDLDLLADVLQRAVHDLDAKDRPTTERYQVHLMVRPDGVRTLDGAEVTDTTLAEATCDSVVVDADGRQTRAVPETTRRRVLQRDGAKCRVPGCRNRLWCDLHHLKERRRGGGNHDHNLVSLCPAHHRLVHDGRLAVTVHGEELVVEWADGRVVKGVLNPTHAPQGPVSYLRSREARPTPGVAAGPE
jgi:hypothetical protein